jgi:Uma2 family endonuclease
MRMVAPVYYSADMVRALPEDGNRYETVWGELLVSPAPRPWHEEVAGRLYVALRAYCQETGVGHVFASRSDISWSPDTLVQPDVFVVPLEEARTLEWSRMQRLELVVEVLSPSSVRADRFAKRKLYQSVGIPLYWIIDPAERTAEIWTTDAHFPVSERHTLRWRHPGASREFVLDLGELFRPI